MSDNDKGQAEGASELSSGSPQPSTSNGQGTFVGLCGVGLLKQHVIEAAIAAGEEIDSDD